MWATMDGVLGPQLGSAHATPGVVCSVMIVLQFTSESVLESNLL
jgi:hypothetical protein